MNNSTDDVLVESAHDLNQRYSETLTSLIVFLGIMAPIGIIGNIIVLVVYSTSKTYRDTNFRTFVLWLAVIDLLSSSIILPVEIASLLMVYTFHIALLCKLKCFFQVFLNTTTGLALLTIAFERYRKICCPLRWQISRGLAKKIVIAVVLFAIILCIPAPIMCGISAENKTNIFNTTTVVHMCEVEERFEDSIVRMVFKSTFTLILTVASVMIILMYGLILRVTCLVRRKIIRQNRTCESVILSASKYDDTRDVKMNPANNSTCGLPPEEYSGVAIDKEQVEETKENDTVPNTLEDGSGVHDSYQRQTGRFALGTKANHTLSKRAKNSSNISGCGLSSKTLIWLILTLVFIVTYFLYAILAYYTTTQYAMTPAELTFYKFLMRIYFINNAINPVIYMWLDTSFRESCRDLYAKFKARCCK